MSGDGSGTVNSNPAGISCASDITSGCDILFLSSASLTLYATPSADSLFENWSGACTNTSGDCSITMNSNKAVTATFIAAPKAMVDGGKSFSTMQAAYDDTATTTDSVIKLLEGSFANTLVAGRGISVKLEGGYNAAYDAFSTETIIQGPMKIKAGTIRMKGVKVK